MDTNNDVYVGDLALLNTRKQEWAKGNADGRKYRIATYVVLLIGLACMFFVMNRVKGGTTSISQLPLHITIWITALVAYLVMRQGKKKADLPFDGFHNARFEVGEDEIYYIYQQGMSLKTYTVRDEDIEEIIRDDTHGVIYIKGSAEIEKRTRKSTETSRVSEFYALVPFDKYELDDLLEPYSELVTVAPGTLRDKYLSENHQ